MHMHLENFSEEEKRKLASIMKKKLFFIDGIYVSILLLSIIYVIYINKSSENEYFKNNIEVINVVFAVIAVICTRMIVSETRDYLKEIKSVHKKVIETKITERKGDILSFGSKSVEEDDFLFGVSGFNSFQKGDSVCVELSADSDKLLSIKKLPHTA